MTARAQRVLAIVLLVFIFGSLLNLPLRFLVPYVGDLPFSTAPDGTVTDVINDSWVADVRKSGHQPLVVGDRIEWEKVPLDDRYGSIRRQLAGSAVFYPFVHGGAEYRIRAVALPFAQHFSLAVKIIMTFRYFAWIFFVLMALIIVLRRPSPMTWGFYIFAIGFNYGYPTTLSFLPAIPFYLINFGLLWLMFASSAGLMEFALRFPDDRTDGWRRIAERTVPWIIVIYGVASACISYGEMTLAIKIDLASNLRILLVPPYIVAWISLAGSYLSSTGVNRQRLRWAILGLFLGTLASMLTFDADLGAAGTGVSAFANVAIPLTMGYAIVRYRVIDVEFVFNRAIVLGAIATLFGSVFVLLDWLFTNYVMQTRWQIAIGMVVAFALGWLVRNGRSSLIGVVDALFFRRRHAIMRQVNDLRVELETQARPDRIDETVVQRAANALNLDSAALFVRTPDGGFVRQSAVGWNAGTAWHLFDGDTIFETLDGHDRRARRIDEAVWGDLRVPQGPARPVLVVPIGSVRSAFAMYGAHADGRDIDPDETRGLTDLCAAAATVRTA